MIEQTLLPDGVSQAASIKEIDSKSPLKRLTTFAFRVMYVSRNNPMKETDHDREQKPDHWDHFTARYHKQTFTCEVTEKEGKPSYKLEDGREFKSPSAAGTAITGGACNGWAFWSLETAHDAKPDDALAEVTTTSEPDAPQENEPMVNIEVKPEEVQRVALTE